MPALLAARASDSELGDQLGVIASPRAYRVSVPGPVTGVRMRVPGLVMFSSTMLDCAPAPARSL